MSKVWIVMANSYEDVWIVGVFSNEEKAEARTAHCAKSDEGEYTRYTTHLYEVE